MLSLLASFLGSPTPSVDLMLRGPGPEDTTAGAREHRGHRKAADQLRELQMILARDAEH